MRVFLKKHKYKFIVPLIALTLIASGFYTYVQVNPLHTHAATTGYYDVTHTFTTASTCGSAGCSGTGYSSKKAYAGLNGSTTCSKCSGNKTITCTTCSGKGYTVSQMGQETNVDAWYEGYYRVDVAGCTKCATAGSGTKYEYYDYETNATNRTNCKGYEGSYTAGSGKMTCTQCSGSGYYGICGRCNGQKKNYYCTNSSCEQGYTTYDNWKTESNYNSVCYSAPNTYTVVYNANGGTGTTASSTHTYDTAKELTSNGFSRTGYTFKGWSTSSTATSATYTNEQSVKNLTTTNGGTVNLYAVWSVNTYTLTFNNNGGSGGPGTITVTYGSSTNYIVNGNTNIPTKTGYTFEGWYTTADGGTKVYDSAGRCTNEGTYWSGNKWKYVGNVTLYAHYTPNKYQITFNPNGGSFLYYTGVYQDSINFDDCQFINSGLHINNIIDKVKIELKGHTFNGFWDEPEGGEQLWDESYCLLSGTYIGNNYWTYPDDITVYAQFIPNTYTITFDANGGDGVSVSSADYVYGTTVDLSSPVAMKNGYIFMGWSTKPNAKVAFESMTMGVSAIESGNDIPVSLDATNITLYAIYSLPTSGVDSVYINYQPTGGNIIQIPFTVDKETMSGNYYLYQGDLFSIYGEGTGTAYAKDKAGNITQIVTIGEPVPDPPKYTQTIIYYTYDYEASVKNGTDIYKEIGSFSQEVIENGIFKPMWAEEALADNETIISSLENYNKQSITKEEEYTVTKDCVINAYYYPKSYNVTFVLPYDDAIIVGSPSTTIYYNTHYGLLPLPTAAGNNHNGYLFKGWKDENGNSITDATLFTGTSDVVLYAQMDVAEFTVVYDYGTNGGTDVTIESAKIKYNQLVDLTPVATKTIDGQTWVFVGWNTDSEATTGLTSFTMPAEDITVYAIYKCILTGTFHQANGTTEIVSEVIYNNTETATITFPVTVTKTDWKSIGWTTAKTVANSAEFIPGGKYVISTNAEYYARYEKTVTLSYDTQTDDIIINDVNKIILYNSSGENTTADFEVHSAITKEKYSFKHWSTGNRIYLPSSTISITEDTVLIAIWDKYPEIIPEEPEDGDGGSAYLQDLYYPLKDANNGVITEAEILSYVKAIDNEDGEIVVKLEDFDAEEFKSLTADAKILVTYRATDSYGNSVTSSIYVYVIATQIEAPTTYVDNRFITSDYFKSGSIYIPYNKGGLNTTSLWITDQQYNNVITNALQNMDAEEKEYESMYYFSKNKIQEVKEYTKVNGLGRFKAIDALEKFIANFFN